MENFQSAAFYAYEPIQELGLGTFFATLCVIRIHPHNSLWVLIKKSVHTGDCIAQWMGFLLSARRPWVRLLVFPINFLLMLPRFIDCTLLISQWTVEKHNSWSNPYKKESWQDIMMVSIWNQADSDKRMIEGLHFGPESFRIEASKRDCFFFLSFTPNSVRMNGRRSTHPLGNWSTRPQSLQN